MYRQHAATMPPLPLARTSGPLAAAACRCRILAIMLCRVDLGRRQAGTHVALR